MIKIEFTTDLFKSGGNRFGALAQDSDLVNLAEFLLDDGGTGVGFLHYASIVLLEDIQNSLDNPAMVLEQYREHWGAIVKRDETKIFWLMDDDEDEHAQWVDTQLVIESLKQCIQFLEENYSQEKLDGEDNYYKNLLEARMK